MDNYEQWERHDGEQERWLKKRPVCSECGEHIQDEYFYEFDGEIICEECLREHRKSTERYMEES